MAYTEFNCQSGGSNLNAGSTTSNSAAYTSTNGNWSTTTRIFTPTDGSTPASTVAVGDWVQIYNDGASTGVFIAQVTAVAAGVNGGITVSATSRAGSQPSTSVTARTLKAGGAWKGPTATDMGPLGYSNFGLNVDGTSGNQVRLNLKNDATYSVTALGNVFIGQAYTVQGYTSSFGDGGRAIIDGGTSTASLLNLAATAGTAYLFVDIIFSTGFTSGSGSLVAASNSASFYRCTFTGARGPGIILQGAVFYSFFETEFSSCNKSNTSASGAIVINNTPQTVVLDRCYIHDNTGGSNCHGISVSNAGSLSIDNTIFDSNAGSGIFVATGVFSVISVNQCDFYNNTVDGIANTLSTSGLVLTVQNSNFIKNGGKGIDASQIKSVGFTYNNGYGSGTQANGSTDALGSIFSGGGNVTYGSNLTPWVDPVNGDFRINLVTANYAGRGAFTQTQNSKSGAIGFPDIGAAQSKTGSGGTFSKEVSYGFNG